MQEKKKFKLPLKNLTDEELRELLDKSAEEAEECQRQLYEEFKSIMQIDADIWNMRFE